jgi:hypothetical protein
MRYILNKNTFLLESVKNKTIYHFTESLDSLFEILSGDFLMSGSNNNNCRFGLCYDNISFTWNPNLWDIEYLGDIKDRWTVRISFDYDRMSKKWQFKPFNYGIDEEMEEMVETDEMNGISEYITEILINSKESKDNLIYLKRTYPNINIKTVRRKNKRY